MQRGRNITLLHIVNFIEKVKKMANIGRTFLVLALLSRCLFLIGSTLVADESQLTSGVDAAKSVLENSEKVKEIPDEQKTYLLKEIDRIEKSAFVRVPYKKMSQWRKDRFAELIMEWIRNFPAKDYHTETILKGHTAQNLNPIAQLYIVPPTTYSKEIKQKTLDQRKEMLNIVKGEFKVALTKLSEKLKTQYNNLSDDFSLYNEAEIESNFGRAFAMEDDLNPFQRVPLSDDAFEKLKKQIKSIFGKIEISGKTYQNTDLTIKRFADRFKNRDKTDEWYKEELLRTQTSASQFMMFDFKSQFFSCRDVIEKAYHKVTPSDIVANYKNYGSEISQLIDSSIVLKASREANEIQQKLIQVEVEANKKKFEMESTQPEVLQQNSHSLPHASRANFNRIIVVVAANVLLVLAITFYILVKRLIKKRRGL
jgi:hypothetical protein